MEEYDIVENVWRQLAPLPGGPRTQHASVGYQGKLLFVSGGLDRNHEVLDSMLLYNVQVKAMLDCRHMKVTLKPIQGPTLYTFKHTQNVSLGALHTTDVFAISHYFITRKSMVFCVFAFLHFCLILEPRQLIEIDAKM